MSIKFTPSLSILAFLALACGGMDPSPGSDAARSEEAIASANEALTFGTMHAGDYIFAGQRVVAANCNYHLEMQGNGDLVAYDGPGTSAPYWVARANSTYSYAVMQPDGNFVVYSPTGVPAWSTGTAGTKANRFVVQNDGNLVLYSSTLAQWSSRTVRGLKSWPCDQVRPTEVTQLARGMERLGSTYSSPGVRTTAECGGRCGNDTNCKSWTYYPAGSKDPVWAICDLKNRAPATSTSNVSGVISGIKVSP